MSSIVNNFAENSVTMNAGSTMNGDVHIENVNQGKEEESSTENTNDSEQKQLKSPLRLSRKKGTKIDFIRVMNAWYECGKVEDMNGNKLTKKDYFDWLGHLFNIDLSGYSNDLSNSMSSSVAYEKQSRIFDELKRKNEEIFNSK